MLFPRRLRKIIFRPNRHCRQRLRFDYPDNVKRAIGRHDCPRRHFSFIGVNVNALIAGNRIGFDFDIGFNPRQLRKGYVGAAASLADSRTNRRVYRNIGSARPRAI